MSAENDKEKILQILGRVSEKKKLDKLKQKYKELYDKVRRQKTCKLILLNFLKSRSE
jgi:hypothetical protein